MRDKRQGTPLVQVDYLSASGAVLRAEKPKLMSKLCGFPASSKKAE
jgi:hypothetical protein